MRWTLKSGKKDARSDDSFKDNNSPFVNALLVLGLIALGFFEVIGVAADASKQIWRDREGNPGAWRGMDRIYLPLLWMEVEKERWRKRLDRWSGEADDAENQENREVEPKWRPQERVVEESLAPRPHNVDYQMETAFISAVHSYERKLMNTQLSLGGRKFRAEDIENSVLKSEGKRRTVLFTVTARDSAGYSLGFSVDFQVTFEYDEHNRGQVGGVVGMAWKVVDEKAPSGKKKVPRKFKCCSDAQDTGSLLRDKGFPHRRMAGPKKGMGAGNNLAKSMHGKMRRVC